MKKVVKIIGIIVLLLIIFLCIYKDYQYSTFIKIVDNIESIRISDNYYYEAIHNNQGYTNDKIWVNGNKIKHQVFNGETLKQTLYIDLDQSDTIIASEEDLSYVISNVPMVMATKSFTNFPNSLTSLIKSERTNLEIAFSIKELKTEFVDDVECYKIRFKEKDDLINETTWVDKENLVPIKMEHENGDISNYKRIRNNVLESDTSFVDIDKYTLIQ